MGSTITEIEIDCIDPVQVSGFWSLILGWEMRHDSDSRRRAIHFVTRQNR